MVYAASDINLWNEWATIEDALAKQKNYKLPNVKKEFAGIALTLTRAKHPDLSEFNDEEICFRVPLDYHAGLVVKSAKQTRVRTLLDLYSERLINEFATSVAPEKLKKLH